MGGYDVGSLFGALNLDDSQFTEALRRAGGASRILEIEMKQLEGNVGSLFAAMNKAGFSIEKLAADMLNDIGKTQSLNDVTKEYIELLAQVKQRVEALGIGTLAVRMEREQDALKRQKEMAQQLILNAEGELRVEREAANEKIRLANQIASGQKRVDDERKSANAQYEADYKRLANEEIALANKIAIAEQNLADLRIRLNNRIAESEHNVADLRIKLANQIAIAEKRVIDDKLGLNDKIAAGDHRMADDKVKLANQYAEGEYRANKIVEDAENELERNRRRRIAEERARFEEHRRMMQLSSGLTTIGVAVGAVGAGGIAGELFAASEAAKFQDAMAKSLAIIGDVSNAMRDQLAASARQAAKDTGLAAKDIATDFGVLAKGGRTAADSVGQIGVFTKYAVATNTELHDSTKQVLTVMESLGLEVSDTKRVTDAFTVANSLARGSVDTLATALEGKGGAALRNSKATLEQSLAITVAFAKAGIEGGAAQTTMAQLVNRFTEAVKSHGQVLIDVAGEQKKWRDIVYDSHGEVRSFLAIIGDLNAAFKNRSAEEVNKAFTELGLGSVRAINSLKPLLGSSGLLAELEKAFLSSGGAAQKAFDTQMQSPLKQLEVLHRRLEDLAITVGIPVVAALESMAKGFEPVLKAVAAFAEWFSKLPSDLQTFIALAGLSGSTALVAGGGLLVLSGSVVRLAADLKLLTGVNTLGLLTGGLVSMGMAALIATGSMLAFIAAKKLLVDPGDTKISGDRKKFGMPSGVDAHGDLVEGGSAEDVSKAGAKAAQSFGDGFKGQWDSTRKAIEEQMKAFREMVKEYSGGSLTTDPDKAAKERQRLFGNLGLTDFQTTIKQLKADLAEAMNLGILNPEQISAAQANIVKLQKDYDEFGKTVKTSLLQATNTVGTRTLLAEFDEIKSEAQDALNTAIKIRLALHKGTTGHPESEPTPELLNTPGAQNQQSLKYWDDLGKLIAHVSDELRRYHAEGVKEGTNRGLGPDAELQRIEAYAKFHGIKVIEQSDLDKQADYAQDVLRQLYSFQTNGGYAAAQTVASYQIAAIEATARAQHISAQDYAKSIGEDYNALRHQVEDTVKAGNTAMERSVQEVGQGLKRVFSDVAGGLTGLLPIFDTSGTNPLDGLTKSFRGAYEQLSAYSNPKEALAALITSIQQAGSQAQANAIAVKYFGDTAGPLLAKELRDGTLAAKDISKAIDGATVSTEAYEASSTKSVSKVTELWQKAVRDIVQLILKVMIEQGFKALIDWMFKVGTSSSKMADDVIAAVKKIGQWIGIISKPTVTGQVPVGTPGGVPGGVPISDAGTAGAISANTAAITANTSADVTDTAATIADAAVTLGNDGLLIVNAVALAALTKAVAAATAASAVETKTEVTSTFRALTVEEANTAATSTNSAATQANTSTAIVPNTSATLANTQAILANTVATLANTAALNVNTTALGVLTAAIIALIARMATQTIGGAINQLFGGGGGGGGGYDPFGGFGFPPVFAGGGGGGGIPIGGGGGGGYGGDDGDYDYDYEGSNYMQPFTSRSSELTSGSRVDNSMSVHMHGPITVMANDPTQFVRKLKQIRAVQGR